MDKLGDPGVEKLVALALPKPVPIYGIVSAMSMRRSKPQSFPLDDPSLFVTQRKPTPYEFVLDAIASCSPETRRMFGSLAVYVGDKIVFALHERSELTVDNGVWLATTKEHHSSLRSEFPNMRSIQVLGKAVTGWQVLPSDAPDFEQAALRACELIVAKDPRIGKVPASRRGSKRVAKKATKARKSSERGRE